MYSAIRVKIICEQFIADEQTNQKKWRATPDFDLYDGDKINQPFIVTPSEHDELTVAVNNAYQSISDIVNKLNAN